jgi:alkanesulfonate monooxygenase SsuD/methylene tetrahydromethanopterin reductase-like flavin-dependent oxidoreductase (luciferase family)
MQIHVILEPDVTLDELTELGLMAERYGIAGLWVQNYATAMDPFMSLVPLARASQRIRLGVVIISPQEMHPLKMATSLLTLNEFSRGRASIVIGRGGEWLGMMGADFKPRVSIVGDAVEIVRRAARSVGTGKAIDFTGESYRARYFRTPWTRETQPARVYAGVTKDRMLQMAARCADGVMLADLGLPSVAGDRVRLIEQALAACGRERAEFRISDFVGWHVKQDREAVYREARRELIIRAWLARDWLLPFLSEEEADLVQRKRPAFLAAYRNKTGNIEGVPADIIARLIGGLTITSPADQMDEPLKRLRQFQEAGLDEICLRLHDDPGESIRLIGERVIPHFPGA